MYFVNEIPKFKNNGTQNSKKQNLKQPPLTQVKVFAKVGDTITITNRDAEHHNILKVMTIKYFQDG